MLSLVCIIVLKFLRLESPAWILLEVKSSGLDLIKTVKSQSQIWNQGPHSPSPSIPLFDPKLTSLLEYPCQPLKFTSKHLNLPIILGNFKLKKKKIQNTTVLDRWELQQRLSWIYMYILRYKGSTWSFKPGFGESRCSWNPSRRRWRWKSQNDSKWLLWWGWFLFDGTSKVIQLCLSNMSGNAGCQGDFPWIVFSCGSIPMGRNQCIRCCSDGL